MKISRKDRKRSKIDHNFCNNVPIFKLKGSQKLLQKLGVFRFRQFSFEVRLLMKFGRLHFQVSSNEIESTFTFAR